MSSKTLPSVKYAVVWRQWLDIDYEYTLLQGDQLRYPMLVRWCTRGDPD